MILTALLLVATVFFAASWHAAETRAWQDLYYDVLTNPGNVCPDEEEPLPRRCL